MYEEEMVRGPGKEAEMGGGISRADLPSCGEMADHHHRVIRESNIPVPQLLNCSIHCVFRSSRRVKKLLSQVPEIPTCGAIGFYTAARTFWSLIANFRRLRK